MTVFVNGEARSFPAGTTVGTVVDALGCGTRGVAVAVNREVVPRARWADASLADGDRVEVLKAAQGG